MRIKEKFLILHGTKKFGVVIHTCEEWVLVGGPTGARVDMERFIVDVLEKEVVEPVHRSVNKVAYRMDHLDGMRNLKFKIEREGMLHGFVVYSGVPSFGRLMR